MNANSFCIKQLFTFTIMRVCNISSIIYILKSFTRASHILIYMYMNWKKLIKPSLFDF